MIAWHLYLSPCPTFIFIYLPMIFFCGGKISLCILACDYLTVAWLEQIRKKNNPHYYWCKQLDVVVYCLLNTIQIIILHFIHFLMFNFSCHHSSYNLICCYIKTIPIQLIVEFPDILLHKCFLLYGNSFGSVFIIFQKLRGRPRIYIQNRWQTHQVALTDNNMYLWSVHISEVYILILLHGILLFFIP